jgi:hypothetical protein
VLAKNRTALLLFGIRHLVHGDVDNAVRKYERDYPRVTYVVAAAVTRPVQRHLAG